MVRIAPSLIALLTAVYMLRASGALDLAAKWLAPLLERTGLPPELLPLMLVRPVSGSGALGVGAELMETYGPDSYVGRVAAVMLGSTGTATLVPVRVLRYRPRALRSMVQQTQRPTHYRRRATHLSFCVTSPTCVHVQTPLVLCFVFATLWHMLSISSSMTRVSTISTLHSSQPLTARVQVLCSR